MPEFASLKTIATVITDRVGNKLSTKYKVLSVHHVRVRAHLAFAFALALLFFDVCRYLPLLGVSSTIENNESQMHRKRKSKRKR